MIPSLSIIVPACNEAERIGAMLDAYLPVVRARHPNAFEIIVVVNGSTDSTAAVARRYALRWREIQVIEEPAAIGKGGAIIRGMQKARGRYIGFVDADGSTPPHAFLELADRIGTAGAIIASRYRPGARVSPQPRLRRVVSRIFNGLVRVGFGLRLTDTQCGAKLFTARAVQTALPNLGITQWAFDVDLLFQLRRAGFEIREIPTEWNDVAGSHLNIPRASLEMLLAISRLRLIYSPLRWVVPVYDRTIGPCVERLLARPNPAHARRFRGVSLALLCFLMAEAPRETAANGFLFSAQPFAGWRRGARGERANGERMKASPHFPGIAQARALQLLVRRAAACGAPQRDDSKREMRPPK